MRDLPRDRRYDRFFLRLGWLGLATAAFLVGAVWFQWASAIPPPDPSSRLVSVDDGYAALQKALKKVRPVPHTLRLKGLPTDELRRALEPDRRALLDVRAALRRPCMAPAPTDRRSAFSGDLNGYDLHQPAVVRLSAMAALEHSRGNHAASVEWSLDAIELAVVATRGAATGHLFTSKTLLAKALPPEERTRGLTASQAKAARVRMEEIIAAAPTEADVLGWDRDLSLVSFRRDPNWRPLGALPYRQEDDLYRRAIREAGKPSAERLPVSGQAVGMFSQMLIENLPHLPRYIGARDRALAMLHTRLAVQEYAAARGRLPLSLNELVPAILPAPPQDPVNQRPFRYHRLPGGLYDVSQPP